MGRVQLQALIAVAAVASLVVVAHFSSKSAAPTTVLGWPRDVFGLYNYNYGAPQVWSGTPGLNKAYVLVEIALTRLLLSSCRHPNKRHRSTGPSTACILRRIPG